jgi:hypothetical protein
MRIRLIFLPLVFLVFTACEKENINPSPQEGEKTSITLDELNIQGENVELHWTVNNDSIRNFGVYRTTGTGLDNQLNIYIYLGSVQLSDNMRFVDKEVPYAPAVNYRIGGSLKIGNIGYPIGATVYSNIRTYSRDIALLQYQASDVLMFPGEDKLLFIDQTTGKIVTYNYITKEEDDLNLNSRLGFCSLNQNGETTELIIPRVDGWVFIYNASTLEFIDQIKLSAYSLSSVVVKDDLIFASTTSNSEPVICLRRSTKTILSKLTNYGDENHRLRIIPGTDIELFGINYDEANYYVYNNTGQMVSRKYYDPWDSEYAISQQYIIIPGTKKVICAPRGNIFDNSIAYINGLPRGNLYYADFLTNTAGSRLYAACSNHKSVEVYNLVSLLNLESIITKGYPFRIFYNKGELIVVSVSNSNDNVYYFGSSNQTSFLVERIAKEID